jgi:hypothetical protein
MATNGNPSDRKIDANRANSKKSTGPKTRRGKEQSAANATKHGAYSSSIKPIRRGPHTEDAGELDDFARSIIDSLSARDAVEAEEAWNIAMCYVRLRRLNVYETQIISAPNIQLVRAKPIRLLTERVEFARAYIGYFMTGDLQGVNFDALLIDLMLYEEERFFGTRAAAEPQANHDKSSRERAEWFVAQMFDDRLSAARWAADLMDSRIAERCRTEGLGAKHAVAMLAEAERIAVTFQRSSRELDRRLERYQVLQRRPLNPSARETKPPC